MTSGWLAHGSGPARELTGRGRVERLVITFASGLSCHVGLPVAWSPAISCARTGR